MTAIRTLTRSALHALIVHGGAPANDDEMSALCQLAADIGYQTAKALDRIANPPEIPGPRLLPFNNGK